MALFSSELYKVVVIPGNARIKGDFPLYGLEHRSELRVMQEVAVILIYSLWK